MHGTTLLRPVGLNATKHRFKAHNQINVSDTSVLARITGYKDLSVER
jgi:hypothetical protein